MIAWLQLVLEAYLLHTDDYELPHDPFLPE
jgi:hypothetical protein